LQEPGLRGLRVGLAVLRPGVLHLPAEDARQPQDRVDVRPARLRLAVERVPRVDEGSFGVTLLPDGNAIAYLVPSDATGVRNRIRIVSFVGDAPRDILVRGALALRSLWSLPGGGFVASDATASGWSSGATGLASRLVGIDLGGEAREWWRPRGVDVGTAIPSPDGAHLAISVAPVHSDAWMVEGF
jgi:hypothetical protein